MKPKFEIDEVVYVNATGTVQGISKLPSGEIVYNIDTKISAEKAILTGLPESFLISTPKAIKEGK